MQQASAINPRPSSIPGFKAESDSEMSNIHVKAVAVVAVDRDAPLQLIYAIDPNEDTEHKQQCNHCPRVRGNE